MGGNAVGGVPAPPAGGPIARPLDVDVNEICVPIPTGTTDISFVWDFYTDKVSDGLFNDGLSIDIVDAGGLPLVALAYADTFTPAGACVDNGECGFSGGGRVERAPAGPQLVRRSFPATPPGAYLSIACWNGTDTVASPVAAVDNIITGGPQFNYQAEPGGPGSGDLTEQNMGFEPGDQFFSLFTLNPTLFPNGWFYGIALTPSEFFFQLTYGGLPFTGVINASGSSCYTLGGVPPGFAVFMVTITFDLATGNFREASAPTFFVTI
jgi:hypothetical protein